MTKENLPVQNDLCAQFRFMANRWNDKYIENNQIRLLGNFH